MFFLDRGPLNTAKGVKLLFINFFITKCITLGTANLCDSYSPAQHVILIFKYYINIWRKDVNCLC